MNEGVGNMNKIELLLADEYGEWTTEIFDCPAELDRDDLNAVHDWIVKKLHGQAQYRSVILFAVYNSKPEQNDVDISFHTEEE